MINQSKPTLEATAHFDTYASSAAADEFAQWIEDVPVGRVVAIAVMDEASVNLTDRARRACEMSGSCLVRNLPVRGSWAMVAQRGSAPGTAAEQMSGAAAVTATADVLINASLAGGIRIIALSAPDRGLIRVQVQQHPAGSHLITTIMNWTRERRR